MAPSGLLLIKTIYQSSSMWIAFLMTC